MHFQALLQWANTEAEAIRKSARSEVDKQLAGLEEKARENVLGELRELVQRWSSNEDVMVVLPIRRNSQKRGYVKPR